MDNQRDKQRETTMQAIRTTWKGHGPVDFLLEEIDRLQQEMRSHGPSGRNYTNQQYVELQELHDNQLTINVALMKRIESERAEVSQLREERDEFKHGYIMQQVEIKQLKEEKDKLINGVRKLGLGGDEEAYITAFHVLCNLGINIREDRSWTLNP